MTVPVTAQDRTEPVAVDTVALRMQDQVGSLETGMQAGIVVFDTANFDLRPLQRSWLSVVDSGLRG